MSDFPFLHEGIILDAGCLINLYASGYIQSILTSLSTQISIPSCVHEIEVKRIYSGSHEEIMQETDLIYLQPLIFNNLLQIVSPENEAEENTVVTFSAAATIDSGEAIAAAIAVHRQWSLGTDDGATISFFMRKVPQLHLISTLEIVKHWADATCPSLMTIRTMLENIQKRARYKPHSMHPLYRWWELHNK